jgi:translation initiation factor 3 subunit G|eukprot:COSAG03_NODE_3243_length_2127_cov_2.077909_1_plen_267_part_00
MDKATGVKTMTEYLLNDKGKRIKKVTKYKLQEAPTMISRGIVARRNLAPFGKAVSQGNGGGITRVDGETELSVTQKMKELAAEAAFREAWKQRKQASAEKWGVRDYSKKQEADAFWDKARESYYGEKPGGGESGGASKPGPGAYVAPAARAGAGERMQAGSRFGGRDDGNSVRISNLSEDASENDVQELCRNFGAVRRVYLATDKRTGLPRGFAFVDFHNKSDAEKAIETLNGYGYDNLILSVAMAEPSKPREEREKPLIRSVAAS